MTKELIFALKKGMDKTCFIELGSNLASDTRIKHAQTLLQTVFPDIVFGRLYRTAPVDFVSPAPFFNRSARFSTPLPQDEVVRQLKGMEKTLGRSPEDKDRGIVTIDIDLLVYDGEILKPKDFQRDYVRSGISELGFSI